MTYCPYCGAALNMCLDAYKKTAYYFCPRCKFEKRLRIQSINKGLDMFKELRYNLKKMFSFINTDQGVVISCGVLGLVYAVVSFV